MPNLVEINPLQVPSLAPIVPNQEVVRAEDVGVLQEDGTRLDLETHLANIGTVPQGDLYTVMYGLADNDGNKVTPPEEASAGTRTHIATINMPPLTTAGVRAYFELPAGRNLAHVWNVGIGRADRTAVWTQVAGTNRYISQAVRTGTVFQVEVESNA